MIKNKLPDTDLTTKDFYYDLPPELIAQSPLEERDSSRLMIIDRGTETFAHRIFKDIIEYLHEGDVLVINDSKVIPARLFGVKEETGTKLEVLLLRQRGVDIWETIIRPGKRTKPGTVIEFGGVKAEVIKITDDGNRYLKFNKSGIELYNVFETIGNVPLPPYITSGERFKERYQTVYAKQEGSAAAPTAGLHFTVELMEKIKNMGVKIVPVMLHVGLGTFRPVKAEKISEHIMHGEYFELSGESAKIINNRTGRLIAVGTTSCRVIESVADENGRITPAYGDTGIFIYPGYKFKAVDALITNFHLPESTLLMLVSAFSSRELILKAYEEAVKEKYRFFSFGDAMLIQ
ncbi:MAG: tRNA preQ1(34) S-adenosylmethionine ribosyltransferase-isomerase QueA [Oscillospiraceae bacterium]|nr:tRNA preQ1(34) S-adenosylmethionine ribosyltransferase-isomerase QueA [Oscillospiraceae bacterium]